MCVLLCVRVSVFMCVRKRASWALWVRVLLACRAGPHRRFPAPCYLVPAQKDHEPVNCQLEAWTAEVSGVVPLGSVCSREVMDLVQLGHTEARAQGSRTAPDSRLETGYSPRLTTCTPGVPPPLGV